MTIWIVSLFDPTPKDNTDRGRYLGIAAAGAKLDHKLTYFTSTFRHSKKIQLFDRTHSEIVDDRFEMVYIRSLPYKRHNSLWRFVTYWKFTQNFKKEASKRERPDIVLLAFPPISPSYFMAKLTKTKDIPFVIDVIDPWPESFIKYAPRVLRPLFKILLFPLFYKLNYILEHANGVIGISNKHVNWTKKYNTSIKNYGVFYPSVPFKSIRDEIEKHKKLSTLRDDEKLKIIYAGSLGKSYDIPIVLNAAEILNRTHPDKTRFLIVGVGYYQDLVREYVQRCDNIEYLGRLEHKELLRYYSISDLGIAQYLPNASQSVTYKFFDYLSAGLPILNSLMAEMAELTQQYRVGLNNQPGNVDDLVNNIETFLADQSFLEECKRNAVRLASEEGDNKKVYEKLIGYLHSIKSSTKF